jgi:hypothetical protein
MGVKQTSTGKLPRFEDHFYLGKVLLHCTSPCLPHHATARSNKTSSARSRPQGTSRQKTSVSLENGNPLASGQWHERRGAAVNRSYPNPIGGPDRLELPTVTFEGSRSTQLRYGAAPTPMARHPVPTRVVKSGPSAATAAWDGTRGD